MPRPPSALRSRWLHDTLGVAWVLAAIAVVMAPALAHGAYLGPFDLLAHSGLTATGGGTVHNRQALDQIAEFVPWTNLAWTEVHHGQLPLWNPYSGLGMPLAFDWQSATFSLPTLVGYLFPVALAYTVQVLTILVIAGTGVYVLGRVIGLGVLPAAMAATVYELSRPLFGWLGWPIAAVMAWAGWLFAAVIVVLRGRRRLGGITLMALVVAGVIYAGQPDMLVVLGLALAVFVGCFLFLPTGAQRVSAGGWRPLGDIVAGVVAGVGLGAPLLLPGAQLIRGSLRANKQLSRAVPLVDVRNLLIQGFDGLPVHGYRWFGDGFYTKTVAYVGVIAAVLVVTAVVVGAVALQHRRRLVVALGAMAVAMALIVYVPVVETVLDGLPLFGAVLWRRASLPMVFALAVLAGIGLEVVVSHHGRAVVRRATVLGFGAGAVVLVVIWTAGRGRLPAPEANERAASLLWPAVASVVGLVVVGALSWWRRRGGAIRTPRAAARAGRWAGGALLLCETAFLVTAGAPLWASSPRYLHPTPAETALARVVGPSLVGFGTNTCFSDELGVMPDVNSVDRIAEFAVYSPLIPQAYASAWLDATGTTSAPATYPGVPFSVFCPAVRTAAAARRFGIAYVLEPHGAPGPAGTTFTASVGGEELYHVPGAGLATLTTAGGGRPTTSAAVEKATESDTGAVRVTTRSSRPGLLHLHLTDVPGWHATIDGRPLALERYADVMLQARIPPGHHVIRLTYWPLAFTVGIVWAAGTLVALGTVHLVGWRRARRRPSPAPEDGRRAERSRDQEPEPVAVS